MTTVTIETKGMGTVTMRCPDAGGYVTDAEGRQPCEGGGYAGSTLIATPGTLRAVAERWVRARRRRARELAGI